jgi:hypothetical protein
VLIAIGSSATSLKKALLICQIATLIIGLSIVSYTAEAQQMVVLKKGRIVTRFNLGDEIRFVLKNDKKQTYHAALIIIREFDFITVQKDTIKYSDIAKLKFKNDGRRKYGQGTVLTALALAGLGLALEKPFGDKNPQAIKGLYTVGILGTAFGTFFMLTSKSSIKFNGKNRLKFINYDSPLYN